MHYFGALEPAANVTAGFEAENIQREAVTRGKAAQKVNNKLHKFFNVTFSDSSAARAPQVASTPHQHRSKLGFIKRDVIRQNPNPPLASQPRCSLAQYQKPRHWRWGLTSQEVSCRHPLIYTYHLSRRKGIKPANNQTNPGT